MKIESTDELFLLWEEVTDAAEEGARESSNKEDRTELPQESIEICPSSTVQERMKSADIILNSIL